jgi:aryl-alcohol dehydrogenase-like predicted oxidoreductase
MRSLVLGDFERVTMQVDGVVVAALVTHGEAIALSALDAEQRTWPPAGSVMWGSPPRKGAGTARSSGIMRTQPLDFVQVTYNILDRQVEDRILPLARDRGIGVIVNRPFREGELLRRIEHHPLPGWAAEIGCASWAQIILKFIISHPVVTCAIPATTRVDHVRENMAAATGLLPDQAMRARMIARVEKL